MKKQVMIIESLESADGRMEKYYLVECSTGKRIVDNKSIEEVKVALEAGDYVIISGKEYLK